MRTKVKWHIELKNRTNLVDKKAESETRNQTLCTQIIQINHVKKKVGKGVHLIEQKQHKTNQ